MRNFINFQRKYYFSYPCPRKLREIVKMTLFEMETKDKIKQLWEEYHANKQKTIAYTIEPNEIERIRNK